MAARIEDALTWLQGQRGAMEALLERLVAQNSFTQNRAGVEAVANVVAGQLRTLAMDVELRPSHHYGPHVLFTGRAAGAPVFLLGHTDTVFPPGTFEGFRRDGDRARGPGAFDMKGGIVAMLFGLAAAKRAGLLERVAVRGVLVSEEEVGSPESQAVIRAHAAGAACALGFESGRPGDLVVTRRKGVASVRVEARGVAAHSGNEHEKGRSAIWSLARFVDRAQALTDYARGLTVNVGTIAGGTTKNTVPASASCEVDLRFETVADGQALREAVEAAAREAAIPGTELEVTAGAWRDPLERTPASSALAKEYGDCQRECGLGQGEAPLAGGGSDACTTGALGIPTIDALGPRGKAFHTPGEEVDLGSLVPKASALARFLARRAG
ncbi:peptidase dimerisation domain protein [Anaeromyxobacter dehalogenans 2CP-1]|uniref:Peptidase dimerisation domain protein n=1 Tax=Anaeromyxobacter dehalogenans (strain ATCC BAA-258 / DSM 21875 / 2CP-1) TaxID=455488 RepID=B8J8V1_ANAD2|nr:M20 family metallopeptidase [Anaeromyxobacter dehalogenans]ACL63549.1 peptidase dimerisation domain protein [Anaeromyxobacter dehalogenans 2CP-1]